MEYVIAERVLSLNRQTQVDRIIRGPVDFKIVGFRQEKKKKKLYWNLSTMASPMVLGYISTLEVSGSRELTRKRWHYFRNSYSNKFFSPM